jgi:pyrrolidone-carboxylate peptidase
VTVEVVQIPVIWGQPQRAINNIVANGALPVDFWLALGEKDNKYGLGPDQMDIESVGTDFEDPRLKDNARTPGHGGTGLASGMPPTPANNSFAATAPALPELAKRKNLLGGVDAIPSTNAGTYLCNEMAYDLYQEERLYPSKVRAGVFVHVPGPKVDSASIAADLANRIFAALVVEKTQDELSHR